MRCARARRVDEASADQRNLTDSSQLPRLIANAAHGLSTAGQMKLIEHVVDMMLDGRHAQDELTRDFLVGQSLADEAQDIAFPPRESLFQCRFINRTLGAKKSPQEAARNLRRTCELALDDIPQRLGQRVERRFARYVTRETGAAAANHILALLGQSKRHQCDLGPLSRDGTGVVKVDSVSHIDQYQIGAMPGERISQPLEIIDDREYIDIRLPFEARGEPVTEQPHRRQDDDVHTTPCCSEPSGSADSPRGAQSTVARLPRSSGTSRRKATTGATALGQITTPEEILLPAIRRAFCIRHVAVDF